MASLPESFEIITEQFRKLPGVGRKSAQRMSFGIVSMTPDEVKSLCDAVYESRVRLKPCPKCGNICEDGVCPICSDDKRDGSVICVVEDIRALVAMEKADGFNGKYHVLGGTISPIDGRGPEDVNLMSLPERIKNEGVGEVIIATNPTVDGESTALYISKLLKPLGVKVTRIGYGLPVGADIDYADEMTISKAIDSRKEI